MSRLPAGRLARIGAWTGAAIAWGTTMIVVRDVAAVGASPSDPTMDPATADSLSVVGAAVPAMPDDGLVILRYVPLPDPQPEVITRYVTVTVPVGGEASTPAAVPAPSGTPAPPPSGGGGGTTVTQPPPPPPPPPAPTPTTAPPAPVSGGS